MPSGTYTILGVLYINHVSNDVGDLGYLFWQPAHTLNFDGKVAIQTIGVEVDGS